MANLPVSRRHAVLGGLCLCCLRGAARGAEAMAVQEVAPGLFVRRGLDAEASAANRDAIANIGFIVGRDSVLVTEPGGSLADGRWLRAEIRKRTDKPISHVVITHVHPDHCLGAAAFLGDAPVFVGHHRLHEALLARGDYYRRRLSELMPPDQVGPLVQPTLEVSDQTVVDLGGRRVRIAAHGTAHSSCDLSMIDEASGLLLPADLLFVGRVPSLDGSLIGWLRELERLKSFGPTMAVPGHGPTLVALGPAADALSRYLTRLRDETRKAVAANLSLDEAVKQADLGEREHWRLFDEYNGRNVIQAYKELEWE